MADRSRFYAVVSAAIADITEYGFDSQDRIDRWMRELRRAALEALVPESVLERNLREVLQRTYKRALTARSLARTNPGIGAFTVQRLAPKLKMELDRRITASADLIKLNREASIQRTLQRFSGWATSIPAGGTRVAEKGDEAKKVRRGISGLPHHERFVIIDQGHKLIASINHIVAEDDGAIAYVWHHVREVGYDARPEHVARDGIVYVIRDNWAMKHGLMKLAGHKYYDQVTAAAEEPFCRCWTEALYTLADLPADMITTRGREAIASASKKSNAVIREYA